MWYVDDGGGNPALVLLHAFPLCGAMWETQIGVLAPRRRVIAPDLRGFGRSEVPSDRSAYSVERWADDVGALVDSLDLGRVVLVGLSMGGYVALAFARLHPERLDALVLADTRANSDSAEVRGRREQQQEQLSAVSDPTALADQLLGPLVGATSTGRTQTLAAAEKLLAANRPEGVIGALEALKSRPDATGDLSAIAVPTLVIVGEQDQLSPPSVAEEMAGAIRGARVVVIPDAGHLSNMENPAAFNRAMVDFLDQL